MQEPIQHALGRIEQKVDDVRQDVLEIKRVAITLDARTAVLERRNWSGGLNGKTWATIIVGVLTLAGTVATAVAMVVGAQQ